MKEQRRLLRPLAADSGAAAAERSGALGTAVEETVGIPPNVISSRSPTVPQCYAHKSATTAIANGAWIAVPLDAELYDYGTGVVEQHSTSTNNSRLTCVVPGLYEVTGLGRWAAAAGAGPAYLGVWKNNTITQNNGWWVGDSGLPPGRELILNPSGPFRLAVGDYVELRAYQNAVGSRNLDWATLAWKFISP